ncbi:MAG: D-2-hydroxyacid dehydrogenase [Victivallales bacterium]|nr:D-2-hydroxyacid dehydrogenase [Victivallales bacterium]
MQRLSHDSLSHKAVILDGHALNPGDLSWEPFRALVPDLTVHDRTPPALVLERCEGADIVIVNKTVLDAATINALPRLRYIGVLATGYNVVDIAAAHARGIVVTNVPAYSTDSVAQTVFAFILEHSMNVAKHSEAVHQNGWTNCPFFYFQVTPLHELAHKTIGIVGLGRIGRKVAEIAHAFGMEVVAHSRTEKTDVPDYIKQIDLDKLFKESDFVTLHCPLTPQTEKLVNAEKLALMKRSAILINTSRGPVVDEAALADALNNGQIAGAAADTLSTEPPKADNPLLTAKNCFITPHLAWATAEAKSRLVDVIVNNIKAFAEGAPINVVN